MDALDPTLDARRLMVEAQLRRRGISSPRVLAAMGAVPRHVFVSPSHQGEAYADGPLPIGHGQTISQPYIVAKMTELLDPQPRDRVLEVGTGSGYQAGILSYMGTHVTTFELVPELAVRARLMFEVLGFDTVRVVSGDGTAGIPDASFERIIISAGAKIVPPLLLHQLTKGGRLVMPRGPRWHQRIVQISRWGSSFDEEEHDACVFVPLRGACGWDS